MKYVKYLRLARSSKSITSTRNRLAMRWTIFLFSGFALFNLSGCASVPTPQQDVAHKNTQENTQSVDTPISKKPANFDTKMGGAITSPLSDLNVVKTEIPAILIEARKAPYLMPSEIKCEWLQDQIQQLDAILGPDVDTVKVDAQGNVIERGSEQLGDAAVGALQGFAEGFIPFRSWVRRLTGADRHAKDVASAGVAGIVRRAFLKGVAHEHACHASP